MGQETGSIQIAGDNVRSLTFCGRSGIFTKKFETPDVVSYERGDFVSFNVRSMPMLLMAVGRVLATGLRTPGGTCVFCFKVLAR